MASPAQHEDSRTHSTTTYSVTTPHQPLCARRWISTVEHQYTLLVTQPPRMFRVIFYCRIGDLFWRVQRLATFCFSYHFFFSLSLFFLSPFCTQSTVDHHLHKLICIYFLLPKAYLHIHSVLLNVCLLRQGYLLSNIDLIMNSNAHVA